MPKVVVTLPAYRAELTLAKTVADIPPGVADQLILVDDASPDNTAQLAQDLGIDVYVHPRNRGYGANQKTCYTAALRDAADVVVMLHPDYQYEPKAVPLLIAPILAGDADMTFGSRFAGLGDPLRGGMPIYRFVGNRLTTMLENLMLGSRFTEMHSGMRAYTRDCLLSLPFLRYSDDFLFDSQFLVDAVTSGLRVVEVPIPTRYTKESSSISIERSLRYVAKSLAYCARQSAVRGRRGRRWPVHPESLAGPARGGAASSAPPTAAELIARAIEVIGGYAVAGNRLVEIGSPDPRLFGRLAEARGWRVRSAGALHELSEAADVLVVFEADEWLSDPRDGLGRARGALDGEGILVLSGAGPSPELRAALTQEGLRMVEWAAPGRRRPASSLARPTAPGLVVARPVRLAG